MHHFVYRNGVLHAEAVNLADLAQAVATPFYCYSTATLRRHYEVFADAFADVDTLICYAMKANSNQAVIKTLAALGAGADVVSEGELKRARAAGIAPDKIMFSGIGKTAAELALAVDEGILCVNVESEAELELLSSIAKGKGRTARISVRVNPDIDPKTHAKIATGKSENKFGIPISRARDVYAHAAKLPGLEVTGSICISAARSRSSSRSTTLLRCCPISCVPCAPTATPSVMWTWVAASAFPTAKTTIRRPTPRPMPPWSSARRGISTACSSSNPAA